MIDVNIKGVPYGIAAALPVFRKQGFGHFVNTSSTAGLITKPTMSVYSGTKFAVKQPADVDVGEIYSSDRAGVTASDIQCRRF